MTGNSMSPWLRQEELGAVHFSLLTLSLCLFGILPITYLFCLPSYCYDRTLWSKATFLGLTLSGHGLSLREVRARTQAKFEAETMEKYCCGLDSRLMLTQLSYISQNHLPQKCCPHYHISNNQDIPHRHTCPQASLILQFINSDSFLGDWLGCVKLTVNAN